MLQTQNSVSHTFLHNFSIALLICAFLFGFVAGCTAACSNSINYNSLIHCAVAAPASLTALLTHVLVPFLLTSLICRAKRTELLHILCFIHAFAYGTVSIIVYRAFGSACWLIHPLLLFTATITLASLFHFWFRLISNQSKNAMKELWFHFGFAALSSGVDYFLFSPYLSRLFI